MSHDDACVCKSEFTHESGGQLGAFCPYCHGKTEAVSRYTVEHLVKADSRASIAGERFRICMNEDCDVVYFSLDNGLCFSKEEVKVPIWFKKNADPKYACYCSQVTETEVIEAVRKRGAKTVQEVNEITGAMRQANCRANNPLGRCCHEIIQQAIDKALK